MRALILWLAMFCGASAMFLYALAGEWKPGYIFGPAILPFLLLTLRFVTARFHRSNWLVRANETGLFTQFRSYLNYQLPADEPTIAFIPYGEILSARLVREGVETPDQSHPGASQTQYLRYIELELSGDTAPLADALQTARSEKAPMEKHWYGSSSTLYQDYPVTMTTPPFFRVRWDVVPRAPKFLEYLGTHIRIAEPISLMQEQHKQLRDLAGRGQIITAIYIARKLHGCSLVEAKEMVRSWSKPRKPVDSGP
jgi:hypothetical protein